MGEYYQRMASGELVDDVLDFVLIAGIIFLVVVVVIVVVIIVIAKKKKSA
jgi:large-conductance mechanosensitive channel